MAATPGDNIARVSEQAELLALEQRELDPGLTELVHRLLPSFDVDDLPTSAVVGLEYSGSAWQGIDRAAATLCYYDFPKNPRAPVTHR